MLRIHFTTADLTRVTLAPHSDPLWDIVFSAWRLRERGWALDHRPWLRALATTPRSHVTPVHAGRGVLGVLAPMGPYFPDFLTPPDGRLGLAAGLDALCHTPRRELRAQLGRLGGTDTLPVWTAPIGDGEPAALTDLAATLRAYHRVVIASHAEVVDRGVAADLAHRVHRLTSGGVEALWASMSPVVRWRPPVLEVDYAIDRELRLGGRGLRLVPSYFCRRTPVSLANPDLPPVLVYPIAQEFAWLPVAGAGGSLDDLIGATRGSVLRTVGPGTTTTQIARRIGISLASASRHTATLRNAGLLRGERDGTAVLHTLTPLGRSLLETTGG
ncbi:ArsR/SmtB family transcription factor [Actinophytocola sp.]|uniref:ArsR/SmtB family transcription factor n=1 Tax=Actinophytocola sp. TaxID=1872138 RepID=UPI002D718E51|nr:helix-turn-helix domain-containing protein [Actinophytocola sp.]HYQ62000.1 helix-turn-helix domain-containing protein [Actinophytocola sp.]